MPTSRPELFEAASDAEGLARNLNQTNILALWDSPEASDECLQNAIGYLHRVANRMGYALTAKVEPTEPARTADALYTEWDYTESRRQV